MGSARDAGIVVSHRLLALRTEFGFREVQELGHKVRQILLDGLLVLRGRRNDLCLEDGALLVKAVAMIQNASGRLGTAITRGGARMNLDGWFLRPLILLDNPQSFIAGVNDFDTAHDDALERV